MEKINISKWSIHDLVVIGVIAALARAMGLIIVFLGGGMNPFSLTLRAMIITVLFIVLRHKVHRFGTLCLATLVGSLTSFLFMAQGIITLPLLLLSAFAAELFIVYIGKNKTLAVVLGVCFMHILDKVISLSVMYLTMRENPMMMWPLMIMIGLSVIGDILGALLAPYFIRELRHAGFINN